MQTAVIPGTKRQNPMLNGLYTAPQRDMRFALYDVLDAETVLRERCGATDIDRDILDQILEGADRFCHGVLAPLNAPGDRSGCQLQGHEVRTPAGFAQAYQAYAEGGWSGLCASPEHGGQGLPTVVSALFGEMLGASNISFALYPRLSEGAYRCLRATASPELQALYGPRLASGEWTGTMCLTEPQAGTDLGRLRTRAQPQDDGSYLIDGGKIFISSGEHDLTENIVHMVLARLPDAPAGTRGISLFLVPKRLPDAQGNPGERNGVYCDALEHKLGLRANATCVLRFEAARGYLVGEANKGLAAMFVMMNSARLGTGAQALGLTEIALQKSLAYAAERLQSRAPGQRDGSGEADPILAQPDVRRMLLTQQAWGQGARMFLYWLALQIDMEQHAPLAQDRERAAGLLSLLTPVAKAFVSDNAVESVNLAVQVHGGSGYIVESGIEQTLRDVRILPIYEGTNGVQAHDLLARKVLADGGARLQGLVEMAGQAAQALQPWPQWAACGAALDALGRQLMQAVPRLAALAEREPAQVGASAADFLRLVGHLVYGQFWCRAIVAALQTLPGGQQQEEKLATARFYFDVLFPETEMRLARLFVPADRVMDPGALVI